MRLTLGVRRHRWAAHVSTAELDALIARAVGEHDSRPGASPADLAQLERRLGYVLPHDLRAVLVAADGIGLWSSGEAPCRWLTTAEIAPVHELLATEATGPEGLAAVLECGGDYVALDLRTDSRSYGKLIDCSHETYPYELNGVCDSISQLLALALDSGGGKWVWPTVLEYDRDWAE